MIRQVVIALAFVVAASARTRAQAPGPNASVATDTVTKQLLGVWEGTYQTDHGPSGGFVMTIARDSGWTVTIEMTSDGQSIPTRVSDFKVEGSSLSWIQELMGMSCRGSAVHAAATLRGEASCDHGAASFLLRRK